MEMARPPRSSGDGTETLFGLQALRAVAALMVLAYHVQYELVRRLGLTDQPLLQFGAAGVDLFFVISGFVMVWSNRYRAGDAGAWRGFLLRRIIRIVPLYWATTAAFLLVVIITPASASRRIDLAHLLMSLVFLPWPDQDGTHSPFYGIGWTLDFEMFFYLAFACVLALSLRHAVAMLTVAFTIFVAIGQLVPDLPFALQVWTLPLLLEFLAGGWIALACVGGLRLKAGVRIALVMSGCFLLVATDWLPVPSMVERAAVWGIPAAMVVAGTVLGADWSLSGRLGRTIRLLGDASYALYLVHLFVIAGARPIAARLIALIDAAPSAYGIAIALIAILLALAVHLGFERPLHRALLDRLRRRGTPDNVPLAARPSEFTSA